MANRAKYPITINPPTLTPIANPIEIASHIAVDILILGSSSKNRVMKYIVIMVAVARGRSFRLLKECPINLGDTKNKAMVITPTFQDPLILLTNKPANKIASQPIMAFTAWRNPIKSSILNVLIKK